MHDVFFEQVSSRDSRLEDLEHQLEQMRHDHAAGELDALAVLPIAALHSSITALTTVVKVTVNLKFTAPDSIVDKISFLNQTLDVLR